MIIKQEEKSPIQNAFDKLHLEKAFATISEMSGARVVDTDVFKAFCYTTIDLLKTLGSNISSIEKEELKNAAKNKVSEHLFGHDAYGD